MITRRGLASSRPRLDYASPDRQPGDATTTAGLSNDAKTGVSVDITGDCRYGYLLEAARLDLLEATNPTTCGLSLGGAPAGSVLARGALLPRA